MKQKATVRSASPALPPSLPVSLFLVLHLPTNSYGCVAIDGQRGVACFSDAARALGFAAQMPTCGNLVVEMTRSDARAVAVASHVLALVLADDSERPVVLRFERRREL